jgi:hypothetical protein
MSWPRDIQPQQSSPFVMPGALQAWSQSGKPQHRSTVQIGRIWSESYPAFQVSSAAGRKLIAAINNYWRSGASFDIEHYSYLTHNGSGTGTARVMGGSQTGSTLVTDGWTGPNPVLKMGDIISIAGLNQVFDLVADAPNLAAGVTTLNINPPIFAGGSPADNAIITYTATRLNAHILTPPDIPNAGVDGYIAGLSITFREAI